MLIPFFWLFESGILFANAMAILNEPRFLRKCNNIFIILILNGSEWR
jgi:hypothetical protein